MPRSPELGRTLRLKELDEAFELTLRNCNFPIDSEVVPVLESAGRILAEDVIAESDRPRWNESFYDGYALKSEDTKSASPSSPVRLRVVGRLGPNDRPDKLTVKSGEAAFVSCGAPLPAEADCVLRVEEAVVENGFLVVKRPLRPLENVVVKACDFRKGEILLKKNKIIKPQDVGLLLELGKSSIRVYRQVRVGIIPVGTELVNRIKAGVEHPDSFAHLAGLFLEQIGAFVRYYEPVPDDFAQVRASITSFVEENDVLLVLGGVSIAKSDIVPDVLSSIGKIVFHGVNVSPGKVSGLAVVRGKPVFMVPAHVGSTIACLLLFVIPAVVHRLTGVRVPYMMVPARLERPVKGKHGRYTLKLVQVKCDDECKAAPLEGPLGGSPLIKLVALANGFVMLRPGESVGAGDFVSVRLLPLHTVSLARL